MLWPNAYGLGMANLGFQQVWALCNEDAGLTAERAFCEGSEAPRSLETGRSLADFDIVALALTYEGDLPRAIEALRCAELLPGQRGRRNCLVVAGGASATANPEPLLAFVDAVFLGEAEGCFAEALDALPAPVGRSPVSELGPEGLEGDLPALARLGWILPDGPPVTIRRARRFFAGSRIVAPGSSFGATALVELCRGCPRRCSFCLARCLYGPFRRAGREEVFDWARSMAPYSRRLGLIGAGLADLPHLADWLRAFREEGFSCSLSSLRADRLDDAVLAELLAHGQRTVTVAPESFSRRDLSFLGKGLDPERVVETLERLLQGGFARIKCYLMMGLPEQGDEDLLAVFDALDRLGKGRSTRSRMTLSWSILLPRPHTALEGLPLASKATIRRQTRLLRSRAARTRGLALDLQIPSWNEAAMADGLARGDRKLGERLVAGERIGPSAMAKETLRRLEIGARPWARVSFDSPAGDGGGRNDERGGNPA